jgi:hypothetical protein
MKHYTQIDELLKGSRAKGAQVDDGWRSRLQLAISDAALFFQTLVDRVERIIPHEPSPGDLEEAAEALVRPTHTASNSTMTAPHSVVTAPHSVVTVPQSTGIALHSVVTAPHSAAIVLHSFPP